jgi:hypothetical protein
MDETTNRSDRNELTSRTHLQIKAKSAPIGSDIIRKPSRDHFWVVGVQNGKTAVRFACRGDRVVPVNSGQRRKHAFLCKVSRLAFRKGRSISSNHALSLPLQHLTTDKDTGENHSNGDERQPMHSACALHPHAHDHCSGCFAAAAAAATPAATACSSSASSTVLSQTHACHTLPPCFLAYIVAAVKSINVTIIAAG